jgi:hypothetical protein
VLGGIYVADRNRTHSRITKQEQFYIDSNTGNTCGCYSTTLQERVSMSKCSEAVGTIDSWRTRKGWYEYAAAAIVVLTLASAFAFSRREAVPS